MDIYVHPKFYGTFPGSSYVFYCCAIVFCPFCSCSQLKPFCLTPVNPVALLGVWSEAQKRITTLSLSTLTSGSRWFSTNRPNWKQTPASLGGAHLITTEPWLFFVGGGVGGVEVQCALILCPWCYWCLPFFGYHLPIGFPHRFASQAHLDGLRGQGRWEQWMVPLSSKNQLIAPIASREKIGKEQNMGKNNSNTTCFLHALWEGLNEISEIFRRQMKDLPASF